MPQYTFEHKTTGEIRDEVMTWEERCAFLASNPDFEQIITKPPAYCDSWRVGVVRPSQTHRDRMKEIRKNHPKGYVPDV